MLRVAVVWLVLLPAPLFAQVKVTRILDLPETRVAQVEIPANDTRPLHAHPEALWHVFVTTDAPMDLLIEGEPTVHLGPWQAHFFKGGTMHGFHNPNARTVRWVEFFALKTGNAVALDESAGRAIALAFAKK
ncbi:MAG TPA: cupin domain-containing protein [Vicinamibacterales bacterium]|nr:cupin domain-containing protein [Vicinamibacterales bacterium]